MLHLFLDIEFNVSPVHSSDRHHLESFKVSPEDCAIWSQYRVLIEPDIVEIQSAISSITIIAHGPYEQSENRNSALDEVLQEPHRLVVVVDAEEVKELPSIIPNGPVSMEIDPDIGR